MVEQDRVAVFLGSLVQYVQDKHPLVTEPWDAGKQVICTVVQLYFLFFCLCISNHFIYSICIVKADSRLVVYRFILFYFVLYICIYVAPWSCEHDISSHYMSTHVVE